MRLSIEQAKKYLQGMHRLWLCEEWKQPYDSEQCKDCDSQDDCLDIVLIMSSGSMSDIAKDLLDTIKALQQENERLKKERDAAFRLLAETQSCDACFYEERCSFSK